MMQQRARDSGNGPAGPPSQGRSALDRGGVSLVELLLVLSLLAGLTSITLPSLRRWQNSIPMEQTISMLQQQLQETRVAAIRSGEPWCLSFPQAESPGRRHPLTHQSEDNWSPAFRWPPGIRCEVLASGTVTDRDSMESVSRIVFHPDGSVEESLFRIFTETGDVTTLHIHRLTGTATVIQPASRSDRPNRRRNGLQGAGV